MADDFNSLSEFVRAKRAERGWTQAQLADTAGVAVDSIRRLESGTYALPVRPRASGHLLDHFARALGLDVCTVVRAHFSEEDIVNSDYRRCVASSADTDTKGGSPHGPATLADYVKSLPTGRDLIAQAALLNAHAIAFLIALETEFNAFEFLVTNQPPFMLFADEEYVVTGSASVELPETDRETYHRIIFEHQKRVREAVLRGTKHYRVVLHKQSLIAFLSARTRKRATRIVADMKSFLRHEAFDLVILETPELLDEFEILSSSYPFRPHNIGEAISVRHRRVGLGNTLVYQLALIGTNHELVGEDYAKAEALWGRGIAQCEEQTAEYADYERRVLHLKHKRIAAHLLDDALATAHAPQ